MSLTISATSQNSFSTVLRVKGVRYTILDQAILDDVSFTILPGEFVSLFGPNGGGKTTLLNLLMGFLTPDRGTIELFGCAPIDARPFMGWVPQHFRPDPLFPICVCDVVRLGLMKVKHSADVAHAALKQVGMEAFASAPFGSLSGGQAQRVLLARALAPHPRLLFLDEPTAGLDPAAQETIYGLLGELKGTTTIVMVTHDLQGALALSDRLLCVQCSVNEYPKERLCHHFLQGLYHP